MNQYEITADLDRLRSALAGMRTDVEDALKQNEELAASLRALEGSLSPAGTAGPPGPAPPAHPPLASDPAST
jgi:hypothetical protein